MKKLPLLMAAAFALACAGAPEPPPPPPEPEPELELAGTYSFTTAIEGMAVAGQLRITGTPGSYRGSLYTDMTGELPITRVSVDGMRVFMSADTPDGPVDIRLMFTGGGETFTGDWALGPQTGTLRGRRIGG